MVINIPNLILPTWEEIKNLPKGKEVELVIFKFDSIRVYGRFVLYEDRQNVINFDVMEHGYCSENELRSSWRFCDIGWNKACKHAREVYFRLVNELMTDCSFMWKDELVE